MSSVTARTRALALFGLIVLAAAACVTPAPSAPYYGIYFTAPAYGYVGQSATLKATATSKLPVQLTLDATSTGCSLNGSGTGAVLTYDSLGTCVVNANEPGDATHAASKQVQRKIPIYNCPTLVGGTWSATVLGKFFSAPVDTDGVNFSGSVNLTSLGVGLGIVPFSGTIACQYAHLTFNGVALTGVISPDGKTVSGNYNFNGLNISVVLHAPPVTP